MAWGSQHVYTRGNVSKLVINSQNGKNGKSFKNVSDCPKSKKLSKLSKAVKKTYIVKIDKLYHGFRAINSFFVSQKRTQKAELQ